MTDVILIPGLWLDAESWAPVTEAIDASGHRAHPLTMPGVGAPASDIGIHDWVDKVVEHIDRLDGPIVVVGHSGGGNVAYGAVDRRPDRVAHVVLVDTVPPPDGADISEFPVTDGVVEFPGWDFFGDDAADLDEATRERTLPLTHSVPARVPTDELRLSDDRRFDVPVTMLSGATDEAEVRAMLDQWPTWRDNVARIRSFEVVKLGTAHWPQFTKPDLLASEILKVAARVGTGSGQ